MRKLIIVLLIIVTIITVVIGGGIIAINNIGTSEDKTKFESVNFYVTTPSKDKFLLAGKQVGYDEFHPDMSPYIYKIYYIDKNNVKHFVVKFGSFRISEFDWSYWNSKIKANVIETGVYWSPIIIYKTTEQKFFKSIELSDISKLDVNKHKYFVSLAKQFLLNDLEYGTIVADFLIRAHDKESIKIIKNYALGKFSNEQEISGNPEAFIDEYKDI